VNPGESRKTRVQKGAISISISSSIKTIPLSTTAAAGQRIAAAALARIQDD
jgi:hypothetical protein